MSDSVPSQSASHVAVTEADEHALLALPGVEGNWFQKIQAYFSASSSRKSSIGYLAGDTPVLAAGIMAGNREKALGGVAGILQSFFLAIDKAKDPISLDGMLTLLDKRLEEAAKAETFHLRPVTFTPKTGAEAAIDAVRSYGTELASVSMIVQGGMTTLGAFSNHDVKTGERRIIWGDLINGVLNIVAFGSLAVGSLLTKLGFKFPERQMEDKPIWSSDFWKPDYLKDLVRSEPSNFSASLAMASSTAGIGSGLQFMAQGKTGAGISQIVGSGAYLYAESRLMGVSKDEKEKLGLVTLDASGAEVKTEQLIAQTLDVLRNRGLLNGQHDHDHPILHEVAKFYASCTGLPQKHQDSLVEGILKSLEQHLTPTVH